MSSGKHDESLVFDSAKRGPPARDASVAHRTRVRLRFLYFSSVITVSTGGRIARTGTFTPFSRLLGSPPEIFYPACG
jgi:hypothetical protein